MSTGPFNLSQFNAAIRNLDLGQSSILDCGCGVGKMGHHIRCMMRQNGHKSFIIGCDIWKPCLEIVKKYNPYDSLVLCDMNYLPFKEKCFDVSIAFDVIEHLPKPNALKVIKNLVAISRKKVVLSLPYGLTFLDESYGNKFEKHLSFWREDEFEKLGFHAEVCGREGWLIHVIKFLRFGKLLQKLNDLMMRIHPTPGRFFIFATKDIEGDNVVTSESW